MLLCESGEHGLHTPYTNTWVEQVIVEWLRIYLGMNCAELKTVLIQYSNWILRFVSSIPCCDDKKTQPSQSEACILEGWQLKNLTSSDERQLQCLLRKSFDCKKSPGLVKVSFVCLKVYISS